jgi:acyl-CoA synthetase (AMP-forming)/AMP-acid ligase II
MAATNASTRRRGASYRRAGEWTDHRIGDLLALKASDHPDRELFTFMGHQISYGEFNASVMSTAADLARLGVGRGDRVLVQLPNCLEALMFQVAAFRIGAVDVPVVPIYREHEMRQILSDSTPAAIIVATEMRGRAPTAEFDSLLSDIDHQPLVRYAIGGRRKGWREPPASLPDTPTNLPEPLDADESALLLYTSGTTSAPKGALISSQALFAHLRNFQTILSADESTVTLTAIPLSHLGGFVSGVVFPAFLGGRSVIMSGWDPDDAVSVIEEQRVTLMMGATVFLTDLVERYERGHGAGHRLTTYACAGSAIPGSLIDRANRVGVTALRAYGMTETAGVCAAAAPTDPLDRRRNWDGRVLPGMEIQAVDENRAPLAPGDVGELRIRGPQLLSAYTDTRLTESQLDAAGWFYPGDIGRVDAAGWVQLAGRSKDIVNRGGEKFSTMDIELALLSYPDVEAAAVTAVSHDRLGEAVGAWLVVRDVASLSGPEPLILHLINQNLARQKIPTIWHVVPVIPTSASGKVQKHRLAEAADVKTWVTTKGNE